MGMQLFWRIKRKLPCRSSINNNWHLFKLKKLHKQVFTFAANVCDKNTWSWLGWSNWMVLLGASLSRKGFRGNSPGMGIDGMRVGGGRCPFLIVGGLLLVCIMLLCNWWALTSENAELLRQIDELSEQLKYRYLFIYKQSYKNILNKNIKELYQLFVCKVFLYFISLIQRLFII